MKTSVKSLLVLLSVGIPAGAPLLRAQDTTSPATAPAAAAVPDATPAAPDNPPPPKKKGGRKGGGMMTVDQLKERLSLTDDQVAKIDPILKDLRAKGMAIRQDTGLSDEDKRAKAQALFKDTHDQIRAVLTPDQQTTFDSMRMGARQAEEGARCGPPPIRPGPARASGQLMPEN